MGHDSDAGAVPSSAPGVQPCQSWSGERSEEEDALITQEDTLRGCLARDPRNTNMMRKSPLKSPLSKKISNCASVAAKQSVQLSSQLLGSAAAAANQGQKLSSAVASAIRSPEKQVNDENSRAFSGARRASGGRGGTGIRERIRQFDSAENGSGEMMRSPHKRHDMGRKWDASVKGGYGTVQPIPPPYNREGCREKENGVNRSHHDDDEDEKKAPMFQRKKKKTRKSRRHSTEDVRGNAVSGLQSGTSSPINPHYCNVRGEREEPVTKFQVSNASEEERCATRIASVKDCPGQSLAERNREAILGRKADPMTRTVAKEGFGMSTPSDAKRGADEHPLICSPLQKHIKTVHDSACSNSVCSAVKDHYPLLPPEQTRRMRRSDTAATNKTGEHPDMLGASAGMESGGGRSDRAPGGTDEERAIDLLTSAAFLFKHSRRNMD